LRNLTSGARSGGPCCRSKAGAHDGAEGGGQERRAGRSARKRECDERVL